jgi:hypothetical protein
LKKNIFNKRGFNFEAFLWQHRRAPPTNVLEPAEGRLPGGPAEHHLKLGEMASFFTRTANFDFLLSGQLSRTIQSKSVGQQRLDKFCWSLKQLQLETVM